VLRLTLSWSEPAVTLGGLIGWTIALSCGCLAMQVGREKLRSGIAVVGNFIVPMALLTTATSFALGWLVAGGCALIFAVSQLGWISGVAEAESREGIQGPRSFRLQTGSGPAQDPAGGGLVLGILLFSLPLAAPLTALFTVGYFACLLYLISLGAVARRRREEGDAPPMAGLLPVWGGKIGLLFLGLCLVGGLSAGIAHLTQGGSLKLPGIGITLSLSGFPALPAIGSLSGNANLQGGPSDSAVVGSRAPGIGTVSSVGGSARSPQPGAVPDPGRLLGKVLPALAIGLALAWALARFGAVLTAFVFRGIQAAVRPLQRVWESWQQKRKAGAHEVALRKQMASLPDPFSGVSPDDSPDTLFLKWSAAAELIGIQLKPSDSIHTFATYVERSGILPASEVRAAAGTCAKAVYSDSPPADEQLAQLATVVERFQRDIFHRLPAEDLEARTTEIRRCRAQAFLDRRSSPEI
jgi:hypothetical protein